MCKICIEGKMCLDNVPFSSYKVFNITGARSIGKTYAFRHWVIEEGKQGRKSIWLRRWIREKIHSVVPDFEAIIPKNEYWKVVGDEGVFKPERIEEKKKMFGEDKGKMTYSPIYENQPTILFVSLADCWKYRSGDFKDYHYLIFDEAIPVSTSIRDDENENSLFIPQEDILFADMLITFFRDREFKLFFLANPLMKYIWWKKDFKDSLDYWQFDNKLSMKTGEIKKPRFCSVIQHLINKQEEHKKQVDGDEGNDPQENWLYLGETFKNIKKENDK